MNPRSRPATRMFVSLATTALLAAAAGCAPPVGTVGSSAVRSPPAHAIRGAYAPAGQQLTVRLIDPIDTLATRRYAPFRAYLETPLMGANGQVFAPSGAIVHGRVISLGTLTAPRVQLEFERVETAYGALPMRAAMRNAQFRSYPGPVVYVPSSGYSNSGNFGYGFGNPYAPSVYGGGPVSDYEPYRPVEIRLSRNARLNLVLTQPVLAPGTTVVR